MIKYKDKFSYSVNPLMYVSTSLIDTTDEYYSFTFMTLCGDKWLAPFVESLFTDASTSTDAEYPYEILGMLIQNKFTNIWGKISATLQIEYNPLTDYRILGTESRATSDTTISNSGNVIIDKVTAFDTTTDDYINDNKTTTDANSTNTSSISHNLTTQKEGIVGKTPIQEYIRREIALRASTDIKDIIIRDTISFICLPIY